MPTAEEAAAANAAYRAANGYPVDPMNTAILSTPTGQAYLQNQQMQAANNDAWLDQQKHNAAFHGPAEPGPSAAFLAINAQYQQQRGNIVGSSPTYQQSGYTPTQPNPYNPDTAAGIAWEVAKTGGATDSRLNAIAERQVLASGGDPGFIRYASDIYVERPAYQQEILTSKLGQVFVNEAWAGVPIRMNLTKAEMAMGAGITPGNIGNYYKYNQDTFMLGKLDPSKDVIGIDPGVHTRFGDFGGPILDGKSYGGWTGNQIPIQIPGRLVGGNMVAGVGTTVVGDTPQNVEVLMAGGALPKPFRSGDSGGDTPTNMGFSILLQSQRIFLPSPDDLFGDDGKGRMGDIAVGVLRNIYGIPYGQVKGAETVRAQEAYEKSPIYAQYELAMVDYNKTDSELKASLEKNKDYVSLDPSTGKYIISPNTPEPIANSLMSNFNAANE